MSESSRTASERAGHRLTTRAMEWIARQRDPQSGSFRLAPESPASLIGTACAVLACETLGTLETWPAAWRTATADVLRSRQRQDGWFHDPHLVAPPGSPLDSQYLAGHATFLTTMALDALGEPAPHRLEFLTQWRDDAALHAWISKLDWSNPWRESNWVEWIGYWLLAEAGKTTHDVPLPRRDWPRGFGGLMRWLDEHQDPETGMWGKPPFSGRQRILHLMAGAYHLCVFYYATGADLPRAKLIVDQVLDLQGPDGLFVPDRAGGGPCEDVDAVDILANLHRLVDYRRADIERALEVGLRALLANQRASGAFVWAYEDLYRWALGRSLRDLLRPWYRPGVRTRLRRVADNVDRARRGEHSSYAGSPGLPFRFMGGDMFSQWFRPLAISTAAVVLGPERSPVWWPFGFRRQIGQGWWPGSVVARSANP